MESAGHRTALKPIVGVADTTIATSSLTHVVDYSVASETLSQ